MTEISRAYLATLDDSGNVPVEQLGNAPVTGGLPVFQASHAYTAGTQISQGGQLYAALSPDR